MPPVGPHRMPTRAQWGRGGEVELSCASLQGKVGRPYTPMGLGTISHHRHQEAEAKAPARLKATETGRDLAAATLPLLFLLVLTVVINPVLNMF